MTFPAVLSRLLVSWIGAERLHTHFKLLLNIPSSMRGCELGL